MARLTVKELRRQLDIELETVWYRLIDRIATLAGRQADMAIAADRMVDQIQTLTQLAAQQAEVIAALTSKLEELTAAHASLAEAYDSTADEVEMLHQWLDRQQQRIVALEKRETQAFTLTESNSMRLELHGTWISDLFNRINESEVKE